MIKASAALALAAVPLAGCATLFGSGQASVHTLALGQSGDFGPVDLTPISVDEDSRCPAAVQCIWAGQVRLKVLLEQVSPQRGSTAQIPPSHYSFTIRYTPAAT